MSAQRNRWKAYQDRDRALKKMGYRGYKEYLESELWRDIRARVLNQNRTCVCCGKVTSTVHHRGYGEDVLRGDNLAWLVPICALCHQVVEHKPNGRKRYPEDAEAQLQKMLRERKAIDADPQTVRITREMLEGAKTPNGGYRKAQLDVFGLSMKKPWKKPLVGKVVPKADFDEFVRLGQCGNPKSEPKEKRPSKRDSILKRLGSLEEKVDRLLEILER